VDGAPAIATGEAEILVVTTSIIVGGAAELVGPVPAELQFYNSFAAGVGTNATQGRIANEFISAYVPVLKANGMEPGAPRQ
jgi:hypothetical protein